MITQNGSNSTHAGHNSLTAPAKTSEKVRLDKTCQYFYIAGGNIFIDPDIQSCRGFAQVSVCASRPDGGIKISSLEQASQASSGHS